MGSADCDEERVPTWAAVLGIVSGLLGVVSTIVGTVLLAIVIKDDFGKSRDDNFGLVGGILLSGSMVLCAIGALLLRIRVSSPMILSSHALLA